MAPVRAPSPSGGDVKRKKLPNGSYLKITNTPRAATYNEERKAFQIRDTVLWKRKFNVEQVIEVWDGFKLSLTLKYMFKEVGFRFMDLPPELSNSVYSMILSGSDKNRPIEITDGKTKRTKPNIRFWRARENQMRPLHLAALVQVNRQVRQETLAFLYGNHLRFDHVSGLDNFLIAAPLCIRYLQYITIHQNVYWYKNATRNVFKLLSEASNLKTLTICLTTFWATENWFDWLLLGPEPTRLQMATVFLQKMAHYQGSMAAGVDVLRFAFSDPAVSESRIKKRNVEAHEGLLEHLCEHMRNVEI